jgi:hypothetical protein
MQSFDVEWALANITATTLLERLVMIFADFAEIAKPIRRIISEFNI